MEMENLCEYFPDAQYCASRLLYLKEKKLNDKPWPDMKVHISEA